MLFQLQGRKCFFAQCFVCVRFMIMLPHSTGLCSRSVRDYAPAEHGIMLPYCAGLCSRSLRDCASVVFGIMLPKFTGLCFRSVRDYAHAVRGTMLPHNTGLCSRTVCAARASDVIVCAISSLVEKAYQSFSQMQIAKNFGCKKSQIMI